jgi:hypothetical protein
LAFRCWPQFRVESRLPWEWLRSNAATFQLDTANEPSQRTDTSGRSRRQAQAGPPSEVARDRARRLCADCLADRALRIPAIGLEPRDGSIVGTLNRIELGPDGVHIWHATLDAAPAVFSSLLVFLESIL